MKFVSLHLRRTQQGGKLDQSPRTAPKVLDQIERPHVIHTYTELRQQIHHDLRMQHPEWVQPDGESPTCDSYEARLMELLDGVRRAESS